MDSLALFTHGEFLEYDNINPELLLYSHGEFPRPDGVFGGASVSPAATVGTGRRAPRREPTHIGDDEEAIALALLFADEDDW